MKNLPSLTLTRQTYSGEFLKSGTMGNVYSPFKNLVLEDGSITNFRTSNLDINFPVNIEIQPSFDGSVNLLLNDNVTIPKLINSRFSVEENNTFTITDHKGNKDTNLYTNLDVNLDTRLYKSIDKIPKLDFQGILINGKMKCGSYHFYFKLSDNDGNETDFVSESGLVTCHIGNLNDPYSIRMGMQDEDSKKSIKFKLSNLDSAYDFVKIYYTRTTSDDTQQDITTAHLITDNFLINKSECNILITGFENIEDISIDSVNILYEVVDSSKSQTQCQNMLFLANVNKPNIPYEELQDLSLRFIPNLTTKSIGNITHDYKDYSPENAYEYYNTNNIYYNLGYWPEEYYRLGIVYIMNDYTLSPVFNTRGLEFSDGEIDVLNTIYTPIPTLDVNLNRLYISYDNDGFIDNSLNSFENAKGVIKLGKHSVIKQGATNSIGIKFDISDEAIIELKKYTKGFFIVRQERNPTIYSQGVVIGKTKDDYGNIPVIFNGESYIAESFLTKSSTYNILKNKMINIDINNVETKAAIIPEAEIRYSLFNQLFTSSNFKLTESVDQCLNNSFNATLPINNYFLSINTSVYNNNTYDSLLTLVKDGLTLTTNGTDYFSSKAGDESQAWETIDVSHSWKTADGTSTTSQVNNILTGSDSLIRGAFGTYVGLSNNIISFGTIFNVRSSDYDITSNYKSIMFKLRMNSSDPYYAISDRLSWDNYNNDLVVFRGDCYICNFTHRMHRNFIDPDLPTNNKIIDINIWKNNYVVYQDTVVDGKGVNRQLITYKEKNSDHTIIEPSDASYASAGTGLASIGTLFGASDPFTVRGCDKINRADVNAVPLGHWITFKIMSNINLSMRDLDSSYPEEEAIFGYKRKFYPYGNSMDKKSKLQDSNVISGANNVTLSKKNNFIVPDVPFIKNKFDTRILYSDLHTTDAFKNGYRIFQAGHYQDYTKVYGSIIDIKEWYGNLFVTLEHGCMMIPVNERAVAAEGAGGMAYINTSNVLPQTPKIISNLFGSTWQESIIKTKTGIYGIDTVAKKIWMSDGQSFIVISDLKVQKFLNDNIDFIESNKDAILGVRNVKTHYNKTKGDIIFTFYNGDKEWSLCYNENLKKFITFYSWTPSYSSNINNTFFTFNKNNTVKILNEINLIQNGNFKDEQLYWNINYDPANGETTPIIEYLTVDLPILGKTTGVKFTTNAANQGLWQPWKFPLGDTYTFSFWAKTDAEVILSYGQESQTPNDKITLTTEWQYVTKTFVGLEGTWKNLKFYLTTAGTCYITNVKLEKESTVSAYESTNGDVIWKHGQSGLYDNQGIIKPTTWYDTTYPFEFEFVTADTPTSQKIFNNLKLISNKAEPDSFEFEVVGEGYDWYEYKDIIIWISERVEKVKNNLLVDNDFLTIEDAYKYVLSHNQGDLVGKDINFPKLFNKEDNYIMTKLPFIPRVRKVEPTFINNVEQNIGLNNYELNTTGTKLVHDELLNEDRVHTQQLGNDIKKYGRVRGNMMYLEDAWDIEIKPINFKYAYLSLTGELLFTSSKEARIRDKYLKIKVKYSGKDLAIIQGIITLFTISYA